MEWIRGKRSLEIDRRELCARLEGYRNVVVDIGTGDGRYVLDVARSFPARFAIGVDTCRENLRVASRRAPSNALYVIANALALPHELDGIASVVTIHFPWGSLLSALLNGDRLLFEGLRRVVAPHATIEIVLNAGALAEAGWTGDRAAMQVQRALREVGLVPGVIANLDASALRTIPTTWAKRLAFGRDPRALLLRGTLSRQDAVRAPVVAHRAS